jgi:tRNA 2-thiocytidine biosynthesis protein TtcA
MSDEGQAERGRLLDRLARRVQKTSQTYQLLAPNDRILVAVSGGKDSYTLLTLLERIRRRAPFAFEIVAVHLDQRQPGYDGAPLRAYLEASGVRFEIIAEDTYSVVTEHVEEGGTYCSLCSRLRRGILYTAAERLGCNKLALGHHRDDALETFLMNLFYAGKLQAMPAKYATNDGRFEVIRPLIECAEDEVARFAALERYPILPCNLCGSQPNLKRDQMSALMQRLEAEHPHLRSVMLNAIRNVRPTHLLDPDLIEAWQARPEHIRPEPETPEEPREQHFGATTVASGLGARLRVL